MKSYKYKAIDKYGNPFKNEMLAESTSEVMYMLKEKKIALISIKEQKKRARKKAIKKNNKIRRAAFTHRVGKGEIELLTGSKPAKKKIITTPIKPLDVVSFTQNLYLLKKADFNNVHALSTLLKATDNQSLAMIVEDILNGVESGQNMYTIICRVSIR